MKAYILDKAFDNLFQMSDRPLTKNDFMAWLSEVKKLEAEPIEERPEWISKLYYSDMGVPITLENSKISRIYDKFVEFIRTEVLTRFAEELEKEVRGLPSGDGVSYVNAVTLGEVRTTLKRWMGGKI